MAHREDGVEEETFVVGTIHMYCQSKVDPTDSTADVGKPSLIASTCVTVRARDYEFSKHWHFADFPHLRLGVPQPVQIISIYNTA
jgi:hypothetical protein